MTTDCGGLFFHSINLVAPTMLQALCQGLGVWRPIRLLPYPVIYTQNNYPELLKNVTLD